MAVTGNQGIDVLQTGNRLIFDAHLLDATGQLVTSGTTTLWLMEQQTDGTYKTYDWNDNTFKTATCTNPSTTMSHQQINNAAQDTGSWTKVLSTLTGFTIGAIYKVLLQNTGAYFPYQMRKFQYGGDQGDFAVTADGTGNAYLKVDVLEIASSKLAATVMGLFWAGAVQDAVQASPSPSTTVFAGSSALSSTDSVYNKMFLVFVTGTNAGEAPQKITAYTGATRTFTTNAFPNTPSTSDKFILIGNGG